MHIGIQLGVGPKGSGAVGSEGTPVTFTNVANYTLSAPVNGVYTITKGGLTGYHVGPYSEALTGNFTAKFKLSGAHGGFFGVDTTTAGGISGTDLGFEFDAAGDNATAKSNATYNGAAIATASAKWFWVRRTGTLVELLYNTVDNITTATVHALTLTSSATLYVNTMIYNAAGTATVIATV